MRESTEMNDPLTDKLGRFTPNTTGLDRDALLFQAGQASVHPTRMWPAVAGLLALSQAVTLLFFLTRTPEPATPLVIVPRQESVAPTVDPEVRPPSAAPGQWAYRRATKTANVDDLPVQAPIENSVPPAKVLTVLSISSVLAVE